MKRARTRTGLRDGLVVLALGVCGLLLRSDAFRTEFNADDYAQLSMIEGHYPVPRAPLELFTFSDGSRREVSALAQSGFYPWFVSPKLKLAMCRPLSSALVWVDHALFGHWALGYHLHSAAWWLLLLFGVFALLQPLFGSAIALLALLFFALDESQGTALGWLAQRNSVVSASFVALALAAYVRHRTQHDKRDAWAAALLTCLALLGGEYTLSMLGYALGYELWLARDALATRLRSLCLLFAPAVVYLLVRSALGFGAAGSGMYVDPLREAPEFIARAVERFPTLVSDLVFGLRADYWTFGFPWTAQFVERGLLPLEAFVDFGPWRHIQETIGWTALAAASVLCWLAARLERERTRAIGAFATGALLALVPLLTTLPSGRLLIAAQLGWSLVLAVLVHGAVLRLRSRASDTASRAPGAPGALPGALAALAALLCAAPHLTVLPALGLVDLAAAKQYSHALRAAILAADLDPQRLPSQRVLLVHAVDHLTPSYFSTVRTFYGAPAPRSLWTLSPSPLPVVVQRTALDTLELRYPISGLMRGSLEPVFRKPSHVPAAGAHFTLDGMNVEVMERRGDVITALRFRFAPDLDRGTWQLLVPTAGGYARVPMPAVGGKLELGFAVMPRPD